MLDKKQIVHIIVEIVILALISVYFMNQNKKLRKEMESVTNQCKNLSNIVQDHDNILSYLIKKVNNQNNTNTTNGKNQRGNNTTSFNTQQSKSSFEKDISKELAKELEELQNNLYDSDTDSELDESNDDEPILSKPNTHQRVEFSEKKTQPVKDDPKRDQTKRDEKEVTASPDVSQSDMVSNIDNQIYQSEKPIHNHEILNSLLNSQINLNPEKIQERMRIATELTLSLMGKMMGTTFDDDFDYDNDDDEIIIPVQLSIQSFPDEPIIEEIEEISITK